MKHEFGNIHHLPPREKDDTTLVSEIGRLKAEVELLASRVENQARGQQAAEPIRMIIAARTRRSRFFDPLLFADPAWDILLELYASAMEQQRISVSNLCQAASVPATTALRWLSKMEKDGLVTRQDDPFDGRRTWISLSPSAFTAMESYFETLPPGGASL